MSNASEVLVTIDNFRTLARKTKGELLNPSIGYEAQNCRFSEEYGSIEKRDSRAKYVNMSTLGTSRITFVDRFYKSSDASKTLIVAYDTTLKKGSDSDGSFTNIKESLTASLRYKSLTFKNVWYACNGTDVVQSYDGTTVNDAGVPIPTAATFNAWSGTGLTGNYYYKLTYFVDGYQEGTASAASLVIAPSNQGIKLNVPISTNTRVTKRYLYRTAAGGAIYYFCKEIANNTDLTVTDNVVDGSLDTAITAPTDYGSPSAFKYQALHKSRVFGARYSGNLSRVQYSDIRSGTSYPDVFPSANYFDVLKDNGEDISFILEDNFGQLIVSKPSAIVKINTDTDDPVGWSGFTNILSVNGCCAPYSAVKTHIGIVYVTRYAERKKRLMRWTGSNSEPIFEELEPILSSIVESRIADMTGHYHNGCYYLSYTEPSTGNSFNDRVLIIHLDTGACVIDKKNIDSFSSWNSGSVGTTGADEGELYSGTSDDAGFVYREDTTIQDYVLQLKSEVNGTLTGMTSGGTEQSPTVVLSSGVTTQWGNTLVSTMTDLVSTLTGEDEYVCPSGIYLSAVLEVNAKNLRNVYFTMTSVAASYSSKIYIRTGDTAANCTAASWSSAYASAADISALTANRFMQYKIKLFIKVANITDYSTIYLYRGISPDDYIVKITFGLGVLSETVMEMIYTSQWLDFGWIDAFLKRVRKQLFQVRIDFERVNASGNLTFGYYLDNSTTRTDKTFALATYASKGYCICQFPIATYFKNLKYRLFHDDDIYALKIKAMHFLFSPEPISELN